MDWILYAKEFLIQPALLTGQDNNVQQPNSNTVNWENKKAMDVLQKITIVISTS